MNYDVHNFFVHFGASINVMPLFVAKKINEKWDKKDAQIIHLERTLVHVIGELGNVLIHLSSDQRVHKCIDIVIMDILEAYGVLLSRDWSKKLQGYFYTNWSRLRLPCKGINNQIWIDSEPYMKHIVTPFKGKNEPVAFADLIFGNCFLETKPGWYHVLPSLVPPNTQLELLPSPTGANDLCILDSSSSNVGCRYYTYDVCTLFFDGSKTNDGFRDDCVLVDPRERKHLISSHLEFECTSNTTKYEALISGLHKAIKLNVGILKEIGVSEIIMQQVHNIIHYVSCNLKSYQKEVWGLISQFLAFDITSITRMHNASADALANATTRFSPLTDDFSIEIIYKPSIPDNITNVCSSNDDQ